MDALLPGIEATIERSQPLVEFDEGAEQVVIELPVRRVRFVAALGFDETGRILESKKADANRADEGGAAGIGGAGSSAGGSSASGGGSGDAGSGAGTAGSAGSGNPEVYNPDFVEEYGADCEVAEPMDVNEPTLPDLFEKLDGTRMTMKS